MSAPPDTQPRAGSDDPLQLPRNPAFGSTTTSPSSPSSPSTSTTPSTTESVTPNPFNTSMVWPPRDPNQPPTPAWQRGINSASESCVFKAGLSGVAGGGLGLMFGLFFGGYAGAVDKAVEMQGPTSLKLRVGAREAWRSMVGSAKNFARFGMLFSAAECTVEKIRAKHDIVNPVLGGCAAGAAMASAPFEHISPRARAMQMAIGCASIGAFSAAIDYYMEYMD